MKDPRQRNIRRHRTANQGPRVIDFASDTQRQIYEYGPAPIVASGGFNATKTTAFILKILAISDLYPKNRGVIFRKIAKELRETTMASFYKWCPPEAYKFGGKRADSEYYLRLNNGSEILFMHMDDPETENVIRGLEINWFLGDQMEEVEEEIFDLLSLRLGRWDLAEVPQHLIDAEKAAGRDWPWKNRAGKPIPPTYAMMTCNPESELHWIYRRFHPESPEHWDRKIPEIGDDGEQTGRFVSYHDLGYRMFQMNTLDNKYLTKQQRQLLLSKDEAYQRRFVRGEWGLPEGQIHTIPAESLIPGDPEVVEWIRRTCTLHRVLDHGDAAPTCCGWFATNAAGDVIAFREYYVPNQLVSYHRREITALSEGERYTFQLADPSMWNKNAQKSGGRWTLADEYSDIKSLPRDTAIFWDKADNNEHGTRNRINEYLQPRGSGQFGADGKELPRPHPITKELGFWPRLLFLTRTEKYAQGCDHIIRETRSQRREKMGTELGKPIFSDERDKSIADHGYDVHRYFIASRPPLFAEAGRKYGKRSAHMVRMEMLRFKRAKGWKRLSDQAARLHGAA